MHLHYSNNNYFLGGAWTSAVMCLGHDWDGLLSQLFPSFLGAPSILHSSFKVIGSKWSFNYKISRVTQNFVRAGYYNLETLKNWHVIVRTFLGIGSVPHLVYTKWGVWWESLVPISNFDPHKLGALVIFFSTIWASASSFTKDSISTNLTMDKNIIVSTSTLKYSDCLLKRLKGFKPYQTSSYYFKALLWAFC